MQCNNKTCSNENHTTQFNDEDFIICTEEHHGVSNNYDGTIFSCRFSFKSPKNASEEYRTSLLRILFESMTGRVNDAYTCMQPRLLD